MFRAVLPVCGVLVIFAVSGCTKPEDAAPSTGAASGTVPQKEMSLEMKAKYDADMKANHEKMRFGNATEPATR